MEINKKLSAINKWIEKPGKYLFKILLVILPIVISTRISSNEIDKKYEVLSTQISNINVNQIQQIDQNHGLINGVEDDIETNTLSTFNNSSWEFVGNTKPNKEGYYCPERVSFPSWFMWTKQKYKADHPFTLTFALKDNTLKNNFSPSLFISYGDKSKDGVDTFYRINIFDGDQSTIRLYDRNQNGIKLERSVNNIEFDRYLTFSIEPVFPSNNSTSLNLNMIFEYLKNDKLQKIESDDFIVQLPIPTQKSQGDGFNYGIGISKGDCFKIISTNIKE